MKELKTYISEGFFNNVGANNIVNPVIDAIKDASIKDKINSSSKRLNFADSLAAILEDLVADMKKGKLIFEYIRNDSIKDHRKITISLKILGSNDVRWSYDSQSISFGRSAFDIAVSIANDLYYEAAYPTRDSNFRHNIANTIKIIEFKAS